MSEKPRPELVVDGFPQAPPALGRARDQRRPQGPRPDPHRAARLGFLFIALIELLLMRLQLAIPENTFLSPVAFNRMLSLYGATAIFLFALPLALGLFYYVAPLQIGARGTALPRLGQIGVCALGRRRDRPLRRLPLHPLRGRGQPAGAAHRARLPLQQRRRRLGHGHRPRDPRLRPHRDRPADDAAQHARPGHGLAPRCRSSPGRRRSAPGCCW